MPKVYTQVARKDYPDQGIKSGQIYHKWQFYRSRYVHKSLTYPKPWELTRSSFKSTLYQMQATQWVSSLEELGEQMEGVKSEAEMLMEEAQDSLDNMPEQLQESSDSGMLLQERIEGMEEVYSGLAEQGEELENLLEGGGLSGDDEEELVGEVINNLDAILSYYSE